MTIKVVNYKKYVKRVLLCNINYSDLVLISEYMPICFLLGITRNSRDIERRQSAIPDKIAQIAKSMYDRDGLGFGESPAKY